MGIVQEMPGAGRREAQGTTDAASQGAQLAFLNEEWLISVDRDSMLERDRFENWTDEMKTRYGRWLFAQAEGGEE